MNEMINQKLTELFPQFAWEPVSNTGARWSGVATLPDGRRISGSVIAPEIPGAEVALFVARYFGRSAVQFLEKESQLAAA